MCSSTNMGNIQVWDCNEFKTFNNLSLYTNPNSVLWSPDGSVIGSISNNKEFHFWDPRQNESVNKIDLNINYQNSKFSWINNSSIVTNGYNKKDENLILLWDIRNMKNLCSFNTNIKSHDNNFTPIEFFVDHELKLIYSMKKGDSNISIFNYNNNTITKINDYETNHKNELTIIMNRHYLNKKSLEIDKFIRFTKSNNIYYKF